MEIILLILLVLVLLWFVNKEEERQEAQLKKEYEKGVADGIRKGRLIEYQKIHGNI